jgi:hypothetical protein
MGRAVGNPAGATVMPSSEKCTWFCSSKRCRLYFIDGLAGVFSPGKDAKGRKERDAYVAKSPWSRMLL